MMSAESISIAIDYTKSLHDIMAELTIACIQNSSDLDVPADVQHGKQYDAQESSRSWAPDWSTAPYCNCLSSKLSYSSWSPGGSHQVAVTRWQSPHEIKPDEAASRHLRLFGVHYDTLETVHSIMDFHSLLSTEHDASKSRHKHPYVRAWEAIGSPPTQGWKHDECLKRKWSQLARTLNADGHGNIESPTQPGRDYAMRFVEWFDRLSSSGINDESEPLKGPRGIEELPMYLVCHNRRVFFTKPGIYGLGPACARKGDIVVVLFGADTPFILRPYGDEYLLMGQAYVDCIMHGELVELMDAGELQEQEFRLV